MTHPDALNEDYEYSSYGLEELYGYMRIRPNVSGLMTDIFVDDGGTYIRECHPLLLFVRNGIDGSTDEILPVLVSDSPRVLDKKIRINLHPDVIQSVYAFIKANLTSLKALADDTLSHFEFAHSIKPIPH